MVILEIYVLDASVFVKWFVDEKYSNIANQVRDDFLEGKFELIAPEFFPFEVLNALIYSKLFNNEELYDVNEALSDYEISFFTWTKSIADFAVDIATQYKVTIYDSYYLALAIHSNCIFITADLKFYKKFIDTELFNNILLLKNYKQPV